MTSLTPTPPPAVVSVTPSSGVFIGGTAVTITGSGFQPGATVSIGDAASSVVVVDSTSITAVTSTGQHALGAVDVVVANPDGKSGTKTAAFTFVNVPCHGTMCISSLFSLNRTKLQFAAVSTGAAFTSKTGSQALRLTYNGQGTVAWTMSSTVPWLVVSPATGSGSATLDVAVQFASDLASTQTGTIKLTLANNIEITLTTVTLTVVSGSGTVSPPFGVFDTPVGDATVLAGSIAVTGWTLDNLGVKRVEIWRDLQPGETTPPFASTPSDPRNGKVFIANGTFVDGARPDVEGLHPTTPFAYRAGWGYLMLTRGLWNQGNGSYTLYAYAFDQEDNVATIGSKTITVNNSAATKPFGSIDTPSIGGDSDTTPNFGWALTPRVNGAATCRIPASGVQVSIDSGPLLPVVYGDVRDDIAGAFPGFSNSAAAGGHFVFNWSTLKNGPHTIGWLVTDDCNRADGIGSRFFNVTTGTSLVAGPQEFRLQVDATHPNARPALTLTRGFNGGSELVERGEDGTCTIEIKQGERVELRTPRDFDTAAQIGPDNREWALPIGSTWDPASGTFYWQPAPTFLGSYRLVFSSGPERITVRIVVTPGSGRSH